MICTPTKAQWDLIIEPRGLPNYGHYTQATIYWSIIPGTLCNQVPDIPQVQMYTLVSNTTYDWYVVVLHNNSSLQYSSPSSQKVLKP